MDYFENEETKFDTNLVKVRSRAATLQCKPSYVSRRLSTNNLGNIYKHSFDVLMIFMHATLTKFDDKVIKKEKNWEEYIRDNGVTEINQVINMEFQKLQKDAHEIFEKGRNRKYTVDREIIKYRRALRLLIDWYNECKSFMVKDWTDFRTLALYYDIIEKSFVIMFIDCSKLAVRSRNAGIK